MRWEKDPDLVKWLGRSRLNYLANLPVDEAERIKAVRMLERAQRKLPAAYDQLLKLISQHEASIENGERERVVA